MRDQIHGLGDQFFRGLLRTLLFGLLAFEKGYSDLMSRSFFPFILASLSFTLISLATKMPMFEWQFGNIVTDFSPACNGALPSRWTTRFGEDLEARNRPSVLENINIVVKRSRIDKTLDNISLGIYSHRMLLFIGVILSISYMWWFLLQDKQNRISHAVIAVLFSILAVFICFVLSQMIRLAGPAAGQITYYYEILDCHGMVTFNARLAKIHYETLLVLLGSILSEVGVFVAMLHRFRIAVSKQHVDKLTDNIPD